MDLKQVNKKEKVQNFFNWLLEEEVILEEKVDLSLCSEYYDPNIYFPKEFGSVFESKAMKRLEKISQLALLMKKNPNAYHTRYLHSLGTYNRKLELIMQEYENLDWKKQIENNGEKLFLVGELIKSATHDIGHMPLSHVMEIKITGRRDFHEEIGKRIVLEDEELQNVFSKISPKLNEVLQEIYKEEYDKYGFKQHDESNYDIDRLDYIQRDSLYLGNPVITSNEPYSRIKVKLNEDGSIKTTENGNLIPVNEEVNLAKEIHVYEYSSIKEIENALYSRMIQYEDEYFSIKTQMLDTCVGIFAKELLDTPGNEGSELKKFITEIKNKDINQINISEYLKWQDIRFWNEVIQVAENTNNEKLRQLAFLIIPNLEGLMNFAFEALDCKNGKTINYSNYSKEDIEFIKKIHGLIKDNTILSNVVKNKQYFWENVLILANENKERDVEILGDDIITSNAIVYAYKTKDPIYIKDKEGNIFELSKHPNRSQDWEKSKKEITVNFCCLPILCEEKRQKILEAHPINSDKEETDKIKVNMSQVQVQNQIEDYFELG